MQQISEPGEQGFIHQRVAAALTSLSALALRASARRFSAPSPIDHLVTIFLDQMVALCEAQQGALFLAHPYDIPFVQKSQKAAPPLPLIASIRMSAEEAQMALTRAVQVPKPLEWSGDLPSTMCWTRSLDMMFSHLNHADKAAFPHVSQATATLLFVWPATSPRESQRQAVHLLPFLADMVDTILMHLFADLQEDTQVELFPAELLATVGHEFRGPLTTIQGYTTTLLRHEQQLQLEERREFLNAIKEASSHLGQLVNRFLELAQFETHALRFMPAPVNLLALVQESITAVQRSRPRHLLLSPSPEPRPGLEADTHAQASQHELTLSGDRRLLRTMLDILLENAVAYSAPESLVEVSIDPMDAASALAHLHTTKPGSHQELIVAAHFHAQERVLILRVRDHGIGIEPVHLTRIFHRFYRVDTSLTREVNGLGLGLALCKAIVTFHRGMLWVESTPGEGSTFAIVLPCEQPPESLAEAEA